jgi:hypothetical protein
MASNSTSEAGGALPLNSDAAVLAFVAQHSERYKELAADDPETTVEGCFPPDEIISRTRLLYLLKALVALHQEQEVLKASDPLRILRVRENPYYESLKDFAKTGSFDEDAWREDSDELKVVVDYLQLPKQLIASAQLHFTIEERKARYQEALAAYVPATALKDRPRLLDFLDTLTIRPLVEIALNTAGRQPYELAKTIWPKWLGELQNFFGAAHSAFLDGLMGEPVADQGVQPSKRRLCFYSSGCVMGARPLPFHLFSEGALSPAPDGPFYESHYRLQFWSQIETPAMMASYLGKVEALEELKARGWDFSSEWRSLIEAAIRGKQLGPIKWVHQLEPLACQNFHWRGHFKGLGPSIATWLMEQASFWVPRWEDNRHLSDFRFAAAQAASWNDSLQVVQALHAQNFPLSEGVIFHFLSNGNIEGARWAREHGCNISGEATWVALSKGKWDLFLWASEELELAEKPRSDHELGPAVEGFKGDVGVLDKLVTLGSPTTPEAFEYLAQQAASRNLIAPLEWMQELPQFRGWAIEEEVLTAGVGMAVYCCQVEALRWLLAAAKDRPGFIRSMIDLYVDSERPITRELLELLDPFRDLSQYFEGIAQNGNLGLMKWLGAKGYRVPSDFDAGLVLRLIEKGTTALLILQALEEYGLNLLAVKGSDDGLTTVCNAAARGGSIEMMKHVRSKGCEWDNNTLLEAALRNKTAMLRWLWEQHKPSWKWTRWLKSQEPSWEWPKDLVSKARSLGADEAAQWAQEHGAPSEVAAVAGAGSAGM